MTHERGGSVVIGAVALLVLAGDLLYVAADGRRGHRFDAGFLIGGLGAVGVGLSAKVFGAGKPIGEDRLHARKAAQRMNAVVVTWIGVAMLAGGVLGGRATVDVLLGSVAAVAAAFVALCAWTLARRARG